MHRSIRPLIRVVAAVTVLTAALGVSSASAASIVVDPGTAPPGGTVHLTGDVLADGTPGCEVPGSVTLISDAFVGLGEFAGVGAVVLPVDAAGSFDETVTISSSAVAGTYTITGRCGGGNLGVSATIIIGNLPKTGPGRATAAIAIGGAASLAAGLALVSASRRRRPAR
jgi:LPXTG-motif cell wall-anchored protein